MNSEPGQQPRGVWAWALYDWANSAFATSVLVAFFPVFFARYWGESLSGQQSTFWLGIGSAIAAIPAAPVFNIERREICFVAMSSSFAGFADPCCRRIWEDNRLTGVLQDMCQFGLIHLLYIFQQDKIFRLNPGASRKVDSGQPATNIYTKH